MKMFTTRGRLFETFLALLILDICCGKVHRLDNERYKRSKASGIKPPIVPIVLPADTKQNNTIKPPIVQGDNSNAPPGVLPSTRARTGGKKDNNAALGGTGGKKDNKTDGAGMVPTGKTDLKSKDNAKVVHTEKKKHKNKDDAEVVPTEKKDHLKDDNMALVIAAAGILLLLTAVVVLAWNKKRKGQGNADAKKEVAKAKVVAEADAPKVGAPSDIKLGGEEQAQRQNLMAHIRKVN